MGARVTLVASTYRSERFLPAWLESLRAQDIWEQTELVVVANDPQPRELDLLRAFAETHPGTRIEVVERETLYRSWNRGIAAASAPLLGIANVDDLRTPTGLRAQVEALERDADALFCYGAFTVSRDFPPRPGGIRVPAQPFEREEFTRSMHLGPFFIWRRTADPGLLWFDEQLRVAGDFDLAIRLALHGTGVAVDEELGHYYDAGSGLSTSGETQPAERTVVELRYGIYDKLDVAYVPQAARYVIPQMLLPDGRWLPLSEVVPDYDAFLDRRRERWAVPPRSGPGIARRLVRSVGARARAGA